MKTIVALLLVLLLAGMAGSITPPSSGDIEGVTVGAWLTGGGSSGSVTITGDSATIMTYIRARLLELTDVDGTTIELDGSNLLTVDTTSAKLAEMIQDRIGEMLSGNTETNVTVTYDDATNKVNFSVSLAVADSAQNVDTTAATAVALGEMIADRVGAMLTGNTETNITVTYDDADNTIDFVVSGGTGDIEGVTAGVAVSGGGTSGTVTVGVDTASAAFDEAVSDRAGEMVSGNTETDIVVTYQDADNTVDIELSPDSIHTKAVNADTLSELNGVGLNFLTASAGIKIWQADIERMRFRYDSLDGLNSAWLVNFIGSRIDSMWADYLNAITARLDSIKGRTLLGNPTIADTLDMYFFPIHNVSRIVANSIDVDTIIGLPDSLAGINEVKALVNDSLDDVRALVLDAIHDSIQNETHILKLEPGSWDRPLADSIIVLKDRELWKNSDTSRQVSLKDSSFKVGTGSAIRDTVPFSAVVPDSVIVDSIFISYFCSSGSHFITERAIFQSDISSGTQADSLVGSKITTDLVETTWQNLWINTTDMTIGKNRRVKVRLIFDHTGVGTTTIGEVTVAYRRR